MIPKIIHYCWFSGEKKPDSIEKCIESWHRYLPEYEIRCWDAEAFQKIDSRFAKEAFDNRKWAFASDYVRLYALYTEGGIYLDSDVQVWGKLDGLLEDDFFTGLEMRDNAHAQIFLEAAVMGSAKGNSFIKACLDKYDSRQFVLPDGSFDLTPIPTLISTILEDRWGWQREDSLWRKDGLVVYPTSVIANTNCERLSSVVLYHLNNRSWIPLTFKEKIIKGLKRTGLYGVIKSLASR